MLHSNKHICICTNTSWYARACVNAQKIIKNYSGEICIYMQRHNKTRRQKFTIFRAKWQNHRRGSILPYQSLMSLNIQNGEWTNENKKTYTEFLRWQTHAQQYLRGQKTARRYSVLFPFRGFHMRRIAHKNGLWLRIDFWNF